jgi:5-methylcytosine-specific restriction endonuclease McrA
VVLRHPPQTQAHKRAKQQRDKRGPNWRDQARQARHRDRYTCQHCQRTEADLGYRLDVHHIIPFNRFGLARYKEANSLRNLVSLCHSCHALADHALRRQKP